MIGLAAPTPAWSSGLALSSVALLLVASGCGEWPRFSHWPEADDQAASVGDLPPEFGWTTLPPQDTLDDNPDNVGREPLPLGHGTLIASALEGTGWDDSLLADYTGSTDTGEHTDTDQDCHATIDFPPVPAGDWLGDVDWRVITVSEPGMLCSIFRARNPDVRADVMLYTLDHCGYPYAAIRDGGDALGWRGDSQENRWSADVQPGGVDAQIAVVAAGWDPAAAASQPYDWGLALIADGDACPDLPDDVRPPPSAVAR